MKRIVAAITLAALMAPEGASAAELIAHPSVSLTVDEVRDLFLGERQFTTNLKLVPVDNRSLRSEFLSKVLQTDEGKYAARWLRKSFREGLAAPALLGSDAEVIAFVQSTPGAVGYVSKSGRGVRSLGEF
jgi:hypothetical protein